MLYIMRHGATSWNEMHKLQGRTDVPLSDSGRQIARMAADECRDVHLDVCYCSPLIRAKETATIVLKGRDIPIITDDRLMEMSFGVCEGVENYREKPDCPVSVLFHEPQNYKHPPEGAESLEELFARTGRFLEEVIDPELEKGKDILIVGHGAMNTSIICRIRNIPTESFWSVGIEQCKLIKLK